jgi:hypothetical protein
LYHRNPSAVNTRLIPVVLFPYNTFATAQKRLLQKIATVLFIVSGPMIYLYMYISCIARQHVRLRLSPVHWRNILVR